MGSFAAADETEGGSLGASCCCCSLLLISLWWTQHWLVNFEFSSTVNDGCGRGYTFTHKGWYDNKDADPWYGDSVCEGKTTAQCAARCSADPKCVAYSNWKAHDHDGDGGYLS